MTYIYYEVKGFVTLTHYPKERCSTIKWSSSHWTVKYSSLWPTFIMRSFAQSLNHTALLSQCMIFIHENSSRYEAKSLDCEIQVTFIYIYSEVNLCVTFTFYPIACSHWLTGCVYISILYQTKFFIYEGVFGPELWHWTRWVLVAFTYKLHI